MNCLRPISGERFKCLTVEDAMAKGKMKPEKNSKKPKIVKPKGPGSAYQQAQGKGGLTASPFPKK